ncbi:MAG: arginine decarboxylase, partial [Deltaproteobacteria bacterium]|nr:arginine decarboxylase [Deltaproteobacteria bacterium]
MDKISIEDIMHLYGIDAWGKHYFSVNEQGNLTVQATGGDSTGVIDVYQVIEELKNQGIQTPCLLRFPQILQRRVTKLGNVFTNAIEEFGYQGSYLPVFPIKVNQQQPVVQTLLSSGNAYHLGIEAGSKPELITALGQKVSEQALTICNGFKDQQYFDLASVGAAMGRNVIVVIEKPFELKYLLQLQNSGKPIPNIGFRIKLLAKGSGL